MRLHFICYIYLVLHWREVETSFDFDLTQFVAFHVDVHWAILEINHQEISYFSCFGSYNLNVQSPDSFSLETLMPNAMSMYKLICTFHTWKDFVWNYYWERWLLGQILAIWPDHKDIVPWNKSINWTMLFPNIKIKTTLSLRE